ncbi:MAG: GNAT family N-acetyltransferase [Hyphomicrobium sp.]|nr:GNAT family N-acetyltransferase [Hyphomicrobium sp.]
MSGDAVIRQAVDADAPAILALTRAAYAKWVPVIGREPTPMLRDYAEVLRQYRVDLLHVDGALAAIVHTVRQPDHLEIYNLAVAPNCQGRGFGRRLLAHSEVLAASLGYDEIRLYTNKAFAENIKIYLRVGYEIYAEKPFKEGFTVYMKKPVAK